MCGKHGYEAITKVRNQTLEASYRVLCPFHGDLDHNVGVEDSRRVVDPEHIIDEQPAEQEKRDLEARDPDKLDHQDTQGGTQHYRKRFRYQVGD